MLTMKEETFQLMLPIWLDLLFLTLIYLFLLDLMDWLVLCTDWQTRKY